MIGLHEGEKKIIIGKIQLKSTKNESGQLKAATRHHGRIVNNSQLPKILCYNISLTRSFALVRLYFEMKLCLLLKNLNIKRLKSL